MLMRVMMLLVLMNVCMIIYNNAHVLQVRRGVADRLRLARRQRLLLARGFLLLLLRRRRRRRVAVGGSGSGGGGGGGGKGRSRITQRAAAGAAAARDHCPGNGDAGELGAVVEREEGGVGNRPGERVHAAAVDEEREHGGDVGEPLDVAHLGAVAHERLQRVAHRGVPYCK